jgi:protein SCO1/2
LGTFLRLAQSYLRTKFQSVNRAGKTVSWSVWIGIGLIIATLGVALMLAKMRSRLDTPLAALPVIGPVPAFTLTNQLGQAVSREDLAGHVWVADIIFTRCAGPCPIMTGKMHELQEALPGESAARLVSLTTDADYDTPAVLQAYADKFKANPARWTFLTGDKRDVARLAIDGLKLTAIAKTPEERADPADLFVHSTIFVIVDKAGQLRGTFQTQGEMVDWGEMKRQILAAVQRLESEP